MGTNEFKSLEQIKGIVKLIPNEEVLEAFKWMNMERIKPLFSPKVFVERTEEGDYCSNCNYKFRGEESDYHYCVRCLEKMNCCDDKLCDKDRERAEESVISFLGNLHRNFRNN